MIRPDIEYSHTFASQLHDRFYYLARHIGHKAAKELLDDFLDGFESRVLAHPERAPACIETADLGMTIYHDYVDPKRQCRVIYRTDKTNDVVYALLFLNTRQSIQQALIQYCLHRE